MWYIYKNEDVFAYSKNKPCTKFIELERMIPIPNKEGFISILNADFETGKVWFELEETEEHKAIFEISQLKEQLIADDYKVTKCYEYSMLGAELPYNLEELHAKREQIRTKINELEKGENNEQIN